jgi:hypothetical protein
LFAKGREFETLLNKIDMIKPVEMFGCNCDNCNRQWEHCEGWTCMPDSSLVSESIDEADWHQTEDGLTYCPYCYHFDDQDNLIVDRSRAVGQTEKNKD